MKLRKVADLKGGEILAKPVISSSYQIIISEETVLKPSMIKKLQDLYVESVYIKDPDIVYAEEVILLKSEVEETFKEEIKNTLSRLDYSNNGQISEIKSTAEDIINNILEEEEVVQRIYEIKDRNADIYEHSVNLSTLVTITALKLDIPKEKVHDLCVGCLLHDIGLKYLNFTYDNKDISELSGVELIEYKKHPVYGYSAVRDEGWLSLLSKNVILYHHETMDGLGYPLHAKEISEEIGIVGVCDVFDEMISGIGCKQRKVHEAVEYLNVYKGVKYDKKIVDTLLGFMAVYATGSMVKLSDGSEGKVIRQNADFVDRPVILLSKDSKGNIIPRGREIDLIKINNIFIEKELV